MAIKASIPVGFFLAALLSIEVSLAPAYSQTPPAADSNGGGSSDMPSQYQGFHSLSAQLTTAVGSAAGKADNNGLTTAASIVPNSSGRAASDEGLPGFGFGGGTPPIDRNTRNRAGGGVPGGDSGLGGPPSQNTIPCGTRQFQCFTTTRGSTLFVPASTFGGTVPFAPPGPWVPSGPVPRLDPVAEAHRLINTTAWPSVTIGINPNPGVVAIKSWFWIQNYAGQVLTNTGTISETHQECRSVSVAGANPGDPPTRGLECHDVTNTMVVETRAGPTNYQWTFGDGRAGSQQDYPPPAGLGRAYTDPHSPSPVSWGYEFSSYGHPDGFPISVAISFMAEFRANDSPWAGLDPVTQTYSGPHIVEQVQPLRVATSHQRP